MRGGANETYPMELPLQWEARQASVMKASYSMIRGQEEPFGRPGQSVFWAACNNTELAPFW